MDSSHYRDHRSKHHHHRHRHHHRHHRDSREGSSHHESSPPHEEAPPAPVPPPQPQSSAPFTKEKNFKLIVDPCLVKSATKKIYRFDGIVASEPSWNVSSVKDPRPMIPRRWTRPETIDLPVPRFKIDKNYVGDPPKLEITITNINDNIDKAFLTDLVGKHGELEEVSIFYHPVTRKHTGIARIVYLEVEHAAQCVAALHNRSVMGKSLNVFIDPLGKEWFKMIQKITNPEAFKEEAVESKPSVDADTNKSVDVKEAKTDSKVEEVTPNKSSSSAPSATEPQPDFNQPPPNMHRPPPVGAGPPHSGPGWQPPHPNLWNTPPPTTPQWAPPPPFMSPPPVLPPQPPPDDAQSKLDLDTRIELLLKGGINGMAPFLSLDEPAAAEQAKTAKSRSSSVSLEEDEPLPPGVELSPSYSPTAPLPSICEYSSDKYLPLSTPPSPFLTEEEYLESLLKWRLRHLSLVQQEEEDQSKNRKLVSDKVSEISSDEDEAVFKKNDDQMSLSSLSSVNEAIEEVAIPHNPYGSYHNEEVAYQQYPHPPPHHPGIWPPFYPGPGPAHGFAPFPPSHVRPDIYPDPSFNQFETVVEEPPVDALSRTVDLALDRVCELMTSTLERDIMKRMTEVLAFNVFEKWWETEEKKYYEELKEPDKDAETNKEEGEEKKSTTDALLNSIIDSNFDSITSGFTLGFRAAMPKMPSFRKKQSMPAPNRNDSASNNQKRNESDDEEMVQLSDSESRDYPETTKRKKRIDSDTSSSESSLSISESSSESESEAESNPSEDESMKEAREDFLSLVIDDKLEEMRSKTPEGRITPLPFEDFSDVNDSDKSRSPSPSGSKDLKRYAMEALAALGLDEFVESVKIRDNEKREAARPVRETKSRKPALKVEPIPRKPTVKPKSAPIVVKEENKEPIVEPKVEVDEMEEGEVKIDVTEAPPDQPEPQEPPDLISVEHSYSLPKGSKIATPEPKPTVASWILDHDYSGKPAPKTESSDNAAVKSTTKERKKKSEKLVSHLLDNYLKKEPRPKKTYAARDPLKEMMTCYEFLTKGVDQEDIKYFKKAFEVLLADESQSAWLRTMHWADHPSTDLCRPLKRARGHQSGCARTQGFYKLDPIEKKKLKHHYGRNKLNESQAAAEAKTWTAAGREARSHQRRLLTAFGADTDSDLLKFNQLKFRKKFLKFGKSEIHDWGLFAKESIAADEMVIEYVGQKVRPFLADFREIKYQKKGIGSSYLFRIDLEHIVDATTCGNLARFINHSCNPNCYAKIITIEGDKKIVIYSKRDIKIDEEITYDYKFPLEEEKIMCLCGDAQCKGTLN